MPLPTRIEARTQRTELFFFPATLRTSTMSSDRCSVANRLGLTAARDVESSDEWRTRVTFNMSRIVTSAGRDWRNLRHWSWAKALTKRSILMKGARYLQGDVPTLLTAAEVRWGSVFYSHSGDDDWPSSMIAAWWTFRHSTPPPNRARHFASSLKFDAGATASRHSSLTAWSKGTLSRKRPSRLACTPQCLRVGTDSKCATDSTSRCLRAPHLGLNHGEHAVP